MRNTDATNAIRSAIVTALVLSLCSCGVISPPSRSDQPSQAPYAGQPIEHPGNQPAGDGVFNDQQVITPSQSIDKEDLQVSYSIKAIPDEAGYLLQLSLVFRNLKDRSTNIKPTITLLDDRGSGIEAYTKKDFLQLTPGTTGKARHAVSGSPVKTGGERQNFAQERLAWANSYWLKTSYKIPPRGIQISGLVYHCTSLNAPMKLTVNSAGQEFQFIVRKPILVVGKPPKRSDVTATR